MSTDEPATFYLVVQRANGDPRDAEAKLEDHQTWLKGQLAEQRLLLTGIAETEGGPGYDAGFLMIRADSFEEARAIAEADPFIQAGIRSIEILHVIPMCGEVRTSFWGGVGGLT